MNRTIKLLVGSAVILLLLVAAAWLGRPAYHRYKANRSLARARTYFESGDLRDAHFSLRQTLTLNPTNLEALSLMASVLSQTRSPAAIAWRQRVVQLSPSTENKLQLASTALQFERPPFAIAAQILDELSPVAATNVGWHLVASQLALRRGQPIEAAAQIEAAAKLDPTNRLFRMNLAVLTLQSTNAQKSAAAHEELAAMTTDPGFGPNALRSLIADSVLHRNLAEARKLSDQLLATRAAQFPDRIQHLTILTDLHSPETNAWLAILKSDAATNVVAAALVAEWMNSHQQADAARKWIASLPPTFRNTAPLPQVVTAGYAAAGNWSGLEAWLGGERWNDEEYLRFAWLARALREQQNRAEMADVYWRRALSAADARIESLTALTQLAAAWNWTAETEELLRIVTRRDPNQDWAWQALIQRRNAAGDTAGLHQIYSALFNRDTNSLVLKNNLAILDLLLNQNTNRAYQFAQDGYLTQTNNPVLVSTYAFSLYRQNKSREALNVMQSLPDQALLRPDIALYYSILLAANGRCDSAGAYQAAAVQAQMLPEERRLLEQYYPKN